MQGMFGPSTADVRTQIEQEITQNRFKEKDDFVGLIGSLADRGFGMAAEAMGGGDPRLQKAKLVQEAVAEAREASQPGDVKEMYKNLAASFAKRGLSQEAAQASEAYRKMSREDKADAREDTKLGYEGQRLGLEGRRVDMQGRQVDIQERQDARAANEFDYKVGRRGVQEQLDAMSLQEKKMTLNKLAVEEANLQRRLQSGFFEQQDKLALESTLAQIQSARAQAQASLSNAATAAGRLQLDRENAAIANAQTKAQTDKVRAEIEKAEREQWTVKTVAGPDGSLYIYKTEAKPKMGAVPKEEVIQIGTDGMARVISIDKTGEAPRPTSSIPGLSITDIDKAIAAREGKK